MKNNLIYILVSLTFIISGCSLDETPLNGPSTGTFPASKEEALSGVLAAYKNLANSSVQYCPFPYRYSDMWTDIGAFRKGNSNNVKFLNSTLTSSDTYAVEYWYSRVYKIAGRIHLVLDNLETLKGSVDETTLNQFKAELLCLRAFIYDSACQYYGDIPFIDHCLTLDDYAYARTPKKEVINYLLNDLDDNLLNSLPIQWDKSTWGTCRIGRAAAYALKARIALNWGYYEEAARCSKIAIELSAGHYGLTKINCTYYATADDGEPSASALFGRSAETESNEWMWAIQYNQLISGNVHDMTYTYSSRVNNGAAFCGPSQGLIDTFQCTDGLSITDSPLYDWKNPWKNRDPRLDLYCVRPDSRLVGIQYTTNATVTTVNDYVTGAKVVNSDVSGNKSEYGPNGKSGPGGYLWRKYADSYYHGMLSAGTGFEDDLDVCILRYAELLLIDAEANIEWEGGDMTRAVNDLNAVRNRVNMPNVKETTREGLRSALRYERKVELCDEGFRWFDIRRWGIAEKAVNGVKYAPGFSSASVPLNYISNAKPTIDSDWVVTYDTNSTWDGKALNLRNLLDMSYQKGKDELWPFPYTEMITNPLIGVENNNPGY